MKKTNYLLVFVLLGAFLLSACNLPNAEVSTPTLSVDDLVKTAGAQTVEAYTTQLAQQQPTNTEEPASTNTPQPTATTQAILPTNTSPSVLLPTSTTAPVVSTPCDRAGWVADVTVPDGTDFKPGETFTKTWRLKNTGTCTWSTNYKIVFKSGNAMGSPASWNLPAQVAPNGTVDISVNMTAPTTSGNYKAYFKLQNASGVEFGLGDNASQAFWTDIDVAGGPTSTAGPSPTPGPTSTATVGYFAITGIRLSSDGVDANGNYQGACPYTFNVKADISVSKAGTIEYYFLVNDVSQGEKEETFSKAETKTITLPLQVTSSGTYNINFRNDYPNNFTWGPLKLTVTCQ